MLSYLLEKEFKQIFRNTFLSKLLIVMPVMFIIIFPYVTNQEVRDVKVGVVDHDHSPLSRRLVEKVGASPYFRLSDVSATYPEALDAVAEGESDLVLAVPRGFERDLVRGEVVEVLVAANSVNGTRGTLGAQYLSTILSDYSGELREAAGTVPGAVLPVFRTEAGIRYSTAGAVRKIPIRLRLWHFCDSDRCAFSIRDVPSAYPRSPADPDGSEDSLPSAPVFLCRRCRSPRSLSSYLL